MPLQGTFDVLDFRAIMQMLAQREMSGRLHVRSRSFAANLFFCDGLVVGADQSDHQAAAVAGDVTQRAQEVCFEMLGTDRGTFEFHPGRAGAPVGVTAMTVTDAMDQAARRLTEWQELQVLIPSLELQPRLVTELDPGQVTLDREQWRVLTAVDGRRNLRSIGRALNLSDFEVCRAMRELLAAKVIEMDMRPAGMAGVTELEAPLATEQVTINGKRATRLRSERAANAGGDDDLGQDGGPVQTIVISPNKTRGLATKPAHPAAPAATPANGASPNGQPANEAPANEAPANEAIDIRQER